MRYFLLAAALISCTLSPAQAETYRYAIKALNMPIGESSIDLQRDGADAYRLGMKIKFSGIVALFTGADAWVNTNGIIGKDGVARPRHTEASIKWGKKLRRGTMDYDSNGNITQLEVKPKYSYPPDERHPLDRATLTDLQDPLSAMLRPLQDGAVDCTVRLRAFDTKERYDLQFSPTDRPNTCLVQPIPVSGYKKSYDKTPPTPLTISFTPIADGTHAIPLRIERDMLLGFLELDLIR